MGLFAISDLHLPAHKKPMDIFGPHWEHHFEHIAEDWRARVTPQDIVLLPGDFSWAMTLEEAADDIAMVGALPGRKVLLRGNHDYWWNAIGRVRRALPEGMFAIQNDALILDEYVFAGSRGWVIPSERAEDSDDLRIYNRERMRLNMSLDTAERIADGREIVVMMHYPPLTNQLAGFSDILKQRGIRHCVYGHLHGAALGAAVRGTVDGVTYHQVSCDGLGFKVYHIDLDGSDAAD
ncbi:MAG: phosphohydrolase [Clostridiales bacterium]|nr:phosphohydrolase [Clostridiales bacterium]